MFPSTLLYRPSLTRLIITVTLLCASLAWAGWVFLHTVGDPHRAERIATAILDSPEARDEIAIPFTDQLVNNQFLDPTSQAELRSVVSDVLADPRIIDNFVAAFGSAQANALGVDDPRPTVIDVGQLVDIVREHVAVQFPELAAQIPPSTEKIEIPKVETRAIADIRDLANTWTLWLALFSLASLVTLMIFGDRRVVLRSFGFWAIFTGVFWAIGPRLVPWLAKSYVPQADGVAKAMVDAVAAQITTTATILAVCGVLAFVARGVLFGRDYVQGSAAGRAQYDPNVAGPYPSAPMPQPYPDRDPLFGQPVQPTYPYGYTTGQNTPTSVFPAQPASPTWLPEPTGQVPWTPTQSATGQQPTQSGPVQPPTHGWPSNVPQPAPILLRPLDLPASSDSLSPLSNPDDPYDNR